MYGLQVNAPLLPGAARPGTVPLAETPAQHIRNALQLLLLLKDSALWVVCPEIPDAIARLEHALVELEGRR